MRRWLTFINIVYWLSLTLWISAIIAGAIAAVSVFGKLPEMSIRLDDFAAYQPSDDPHAQGRIAAGMVMERLFWIVDMIQFVAAPLLAVTLVMQLIAGRGAAKTPANLIRTMCVVIAIGTFAWQSALLTPEMNRELRAYWAAAKAGQLEAAQRHKAAFDADHPRATLLYDIRLLTLLAALVASAAMTAPPTDSRSPQTQLQSPRLLKQ